MLCNTCKLWTLPIQVYHWYLTIFSFSWWFSSLGTKETEKWEVNWGVQVSKTELTIDTLKRISPWSYRIQTIKLSFYFIFSRKSRDPLHFYVLSFSDIMQQMFIRHALYLLVCNVGVILYTGNIAGIYSQAPVAGWIEALQKLLPSGTQRFNLIWKKKGLSRGNQVKDLEVTSSWIRMGPTSKDKSIEKKGNRSTGMEKKHDKSHEKMEAETGMMSVGAMQCRGLPAATRPGRGMEGLSPKLSDGTQHCRHLDFRLCPPGMWENTFLLF